MKPLFSDHASAMSRPAAAPATVATTRPYTPSRASSLPMSCSNAHEIHTGSSAYGVSASCGLHATRDCDRVAAVVVGLPLPQRERVGTEDRLRPLDVVGARRPRAQRPEEAAGEVDGLHRPDRNTKSMRRFSNGRRNSLMMPVENTSRNSTRKP